MESGARIVATDNSPYAPALYFADKQYIVPRIDTPEYIDNLLDICRKEKIDMATTLIDPEIMILADSRRMWRVFDNLMNNACKYSQQGTRVYLSLEAEGQEAVITFKNTSARQLDISPEELMERFVRGDSSRNTEGNGLGLSIARSLTELQGGSFSLQVDGDLFKAILRFPIFFMNS